MRRFEGKCALITGAASGIGRATALRLASEGAAIHGVDLDDAGLAETVAQVQAAGGKMSASRRDLSKRDGCLGAVDDALASLGKLDVLGNIAGISRFHIFEQLPEADWNLMLMTEYKDLASMEAAEPKADALGQKLFGGDEKVRQGYKERLEIREVLGNRLSREIILEPR